MHSLTIVATLFAAALSVSPVAVAQPAKVAAGDKGDLWETTVKMEMAGMPFAMPAQTHRMCLGKQARDDDLVPRNDDCRVTESSRSGNTQRFRMVCTGKNPMTGDGEVTRTTDGYNGRMRMVGKMEGEAVDMTQTFSGRKLGDCTGTVQNQIAKAKADGEANLAEVCRQGIERLAPEYFFQQGGAPCEAKRGEFCGEVTKVAASAREPSGYTAMMKRNGNAGTAFAACNQDFAATQRAACARAGEAKNLDFIASGACDDDVRRIGESSCRGRSFTAIEASMRGVCSRYAAVTRGQGTPTSTAAASPTPAAQAPKPADPVQQGLDAVRKLLPF
jgi:hypothetical protein